MEKRSNKFCVIQTLVKGALALTFIFALNSIAYVTYQKKLDTTLEQREAAEAFFYSTGIDQVSLGGNITNTINNCTNPSDLSCEILLENLLGLRNRFYDYSILLWNTLGYTKESQPVLKLLERENKVGLFIHDFFGISLNDAKKQNAFTAQAYLELVKERGRKLPTPRINQTEILGFQNYIDESYRDLETIFEQAIVKDEEVSAARDQTALMFFLLILAEIILFTFVNTADLIINSSSKDESNSITTR